MEQACQMVGIVYGHRTAWNTFAVRIVHLKEMKSSALSVVSQTSVMKKD
jgi:hypothetical protein